jgi:hydroxymethylbilane synthase
MPTDLPAGLTLAAIPAREDARDAIVGRKLADLRKGARVGTSSLRRAAQLRAIRPDLQIEPVRGNLDTRLRKLDSGEFQSIVLAAAGLRRLGWSDRITELLPVEVMCPAVGQGALAIEARQEPGPLMDKLRTLNDESTRTAVTAERALLAGLGGGCQVPIGAHAWIENGQLHLRAVVAAPDGSRLIARRVEGNPPDAQAMGSRLAEELLEGGARGILEAVYGAA